MAGFKKGSIGAILMDDLNRLKDERDALINDLKNQDLSSDKLEAIMSTIVVYNTIIRELEHIVKRAKLARKSE